MNNAHTFYIPVMGTGFTIDTPLKIAKYGISSVISLVDDVLIEQMRKFHSEKANELYTPITSQDKDARAKRITAYLNLLHKLIQKQVQKMQASPFDTNEELNKYFQLLPASSPLKEPYEKMLKLENSAHNTDKIALQEQLKAAIIPGDIDVNIMTKLNKSNSYNNEKLPREFDDALSALRGYANSDLSSSVVFSAGFNPALYGYLKEFKDFFPNADGCFKKKIILKVSDYRSAEIQGKFLAKHGIWVSEYRIESSINCGGHAFLNDGNLLGPVLEEFKQGKPQLLETLREIYIKALNKMQKYNENIALDIRITVQGGIGTSQEHNFLIDYYNVDAAGWGTPFMLVPEVTNLDNEHIDALLNATEKDVYLSDSSPFGIPFWNLATSASEKMRETLIAQGKPGAVCTLGFVKLNTEFTQDPICASSNAYQKCKLLQLKETNLQEEEYKIAEKGILSKSCICCGLAASATKKYGIDENAKAAVCPGPNIINFAKKATLMEMVEHIYGKISLLKNKNRPHMFVKELSLYIDNLCNEIKKISRDSLNGPQKKLQDMKNNLNEGIIYYRNIAKNFTEQQHINFVNHLDELAHKLKLLVNV